MNEAEQHTEWVGEALLVCGRTHLEDDETGRVIDSADR